MFKNSRNPQKGNIDLEFKEKIRLNIENAENKKFSSKKLNDLDAILIKVHLERAVLEYALSFRRYADKQITEEINNYILDLSDSLFLDSTFLGSIILILKRIKLMGGTLKIIVNENKLVVLSQISNIKVIMDTYSSVDEAISALSKK